MAGGHQAPSHYPNQFEFLPEPIWILIQISQKFVCKDQIDNIPALVLKKSFTLNRLQTIIWTNDVLVYWCI